MATPQPHRGNPLDGEGADDAATLSVYRPFDVDRLAEWLWVGGHIKGGDDEDESQYGENGDAFVMWLAENGVSHILNVAGEHDDDKEARRRDLTALQLSWTDHYKEGQAGAGVVPQDLPPLQDALTALLWIVEQRDAQARAGRRFAVYVHCHSGKHRGPFLASYLLAATTVWVARDAARYVTARHQSTDLGAVPGYLSHLDWLVTMTRGDFDYRAPWTNSVPRLRLHLALLPSVTPPPRLTVPPSSRLLPVQPKVEDRALDTRRDPDLDGDTDLGGGPRDDADGDAGYQFLAHSAAQLPAGFVSSTFPHPDRSWLMRPATEGYVPPAARDHLAGVVAPLQLDPGDRETLARALHASMHRAFVARTAELGGVAVASTVAREALAERARAIAAGVVERHNHGVARAALAAAKVVHGQPEAAGDARAAMHARATRFVVGQEGRLHQAARYAVDTATSLADLYAPGQGGADARYLVVGDADDPYRDVGSDGPIPAGGDCPLCGAYAGRVLTRAEAFRTFFPAHPGCGHRLQLVTASPTGK